MKSAWSAFGCVVAVGSVLTGSLAGQETPKRITLTEAIALAEAQSAAAGTAAASLEAARWRAREFDARYLPQITLNGNVPSYFRRIDQVVQPDGSLRFVGRSQTQSSLSLQLQQQLPFTGGQLYFSSNLTRVDFSGANDSRYWSSSPVVVGLRQELFRINSFAWDARAQELTSRAAEREYLEARENIAAQTVTAFFDVFRSQMSLQNAHDNVAVNDTLYQLNQGRFEVGKIGEDDLLQSELALLRARTAVEDQRLAFERSLAAFRLHLGLPAGAAIAVVPPTGIPEAEVDSALAVQSALRNGSATVTRELQGLQADRGVREARSSAGFGASLTAEVGYNQTAPSFDDAYRSLLGQQQIAIGVQVPLLQWGAGKARVEAARVLQRQADQNARFQEEEQTQEVYFAVQELAQRGRQVALSAKADTIAAKRFDVAKNRYLVGKIDGTVLFNAQSEKDAALQTYMQSLGAYWAAYYRLRRLTLYDFAAKRDIAPAPGGER